MPTTLDRKRLDLAFDNLGADVPAGRASAAALGVASTHETVRSEAFGQTAGTHLTTDHIFMLESITKPIVATAVMQLVADGRLLLNEPLAKQLYHQVHAQFARKSSLQLVGLDRRQRVFLRRLYKHARYSRQVVTLEVQVGKLTRSGKQSRFYARVCLTEPWQLV